MLNVPALKFLEWSTGRALPVVLSEVTGVSERAVRGWATAQPRPGTLARASQHAIDHARNALAKAGNPAEHVDSRLSRHPGMTNLGALYATMVYETQVDGVMAFPHTLQFALAIDTVSSRLWEHRSKDRFDEFRQALREGPLADPDYFLQSSEEAARGSRPELLTRLESVDSWAEIDKIVCTVTGNALFSLLARWDGEFCSQFFSGYEARPLFTLVLPRLDPRALKADGSGGVTRRRGMFHYPVRPLLDVLACVGQFVRRGQWPKRAPSVKRVSIDCNEARQNLNNWRDGTKAFRLKHFESLWERLCSRDRGPGRTCEATPPRPLFVATVLWQKLLSSAGNKGNRRIFLIDDDYRFWWDRHYTELTARGCAFGKKPWPPCLNDV